MRRLAFLASTLALTFVAAGRARADGALLDLGVVHGRTAVTDQFALDSTAVRFAIRGDLDSRIPYFHIGAEAEEGSLAGTTPLRRGVVPGGKGDTGIARPDDGGVLGAAPESTGGGSSGSPLDGNVLALRALAGFHAWPASWIRLGADFAFGVRDAWVESYSGMDVAGRKMEPLAEVRSRVDVRVSERWLVGVTASNDVIEQRDVSVGLLLTLDCTR